jgi:carbamoyltransferase
MKSLGFSFTHDASVCLYENGKIISFYKEERLSKIKRAEKPILSLNAILKDQKFIDLVSCCAVRKQDDQRDFYLSQIQKLSSFSNLYDFSDSHHLQHASLAFYNSGFSSAAVIVVDRNGSIFLDSSRESETIFYATYPDSFVEVYKNFWVYDNSIHLKVENYKKNTDCEIDARSMFGTVKVYEAATTMIGQHPLENGKTMGLSAYGNNNKNFPNLFVEGTNIPNDYYFSHVNNFEIYESSFYNLSDKRVLEVTKENYQFYADLALQVQKQTQDSVCYLINKAIEKTGQKNIVISGGYGLNVVANNHYLKSFPDANFYFEPIADDTGNSIGGAMLAYRIETKDTKIYPQTHTFFHGKEYDLSDIEGERVDVEDISNMLLDRKIVALYEGMAEAGPRALGHRSILYYPKDENSKDVINSVKKREWYRPFAAMILQEDAHKYFEMSGINSSPSMTVSFDAKNIFKNNFPGVVHVDGTCRIQTVDKNMPTAYNLLKTLKKKDGFGVILNTSFNLAGEPLIETPEDAIKTFNNSKIDTLWFPSINSAIIKK